MVGIASTRSFSGAVIVFAAPSRAGLAGTSVCTSGEKCYAIVELTLVRTKSIAALQGCRAGAVDIHTEPCRAGNLALQGSVRSPAGLHASARPAKGDGLVYLRVPSPPPRLPAPRLLHAAFGLGSWAWFRVRDLRGGSSTCSVLCKELPWSHVMIPVKGHGLPLACPLVV